MSNTIQASTLTFENSNKSDLIELLQGEKAKNVQLVKKIVELEQKLADSEDTKNVFIRKQAAVNELMKGIKNIEMKKQRGVKRRSECSADDIVTVQKTQTNAEQEEPESNFAAKRGFFSPPTNAEKVMESLKQKNSL